MFKPPELKKGKGFAPTPSMGPDSGVRIKGHLRYMEHRGRHGVRMAYMGGNGIPE